MAELLKCCGRKSHIVLKIDDMEALSKRYQYLLQDITDTIKQERLYRGAKTESEYIVINTDEPYIDEIIEVLKRNGAWG